MKRAAATAAWILVGLPLAEATQNMASQRGSASECEELRDAGMLRPPCQHQWIQRRCSAMCGPRYPPYEPATGEERDGLYEVHIRHPLPRGPEASMCRFGMCTILFLVGQRTISQAQNARWSVCLAWLPRFPSTDAPQCVATAGSEDKAADRLENWRKLASINFAEDALRASTLTSPWFVIVAMADGAPKVIPSPHPTPLIISCTSLRALHSSDLAVGDPLGKQSTMQPVSQSKSQPAAVQLSLGFKLVDLMRTVHALVDVSWRTFHARSYPAKTGEFRTLQD